MARGLDWKVLVWMGCAACSNSGEAMMENGAMIPASNTATTSVQPTSGAAGMRSPASAPEAGKPASPTNTAMTTPTASPTAGTMAAANGGRAGSGASAAGSGAAAGSVAASSAGAAAAAGTSATAGMSAAAGGGATEGGTSDFKRPCISAGNEVVFVGDSYSDYPIAHASLASFMQTLAVKDGALEQGDRYRNLAVAGTTLGDTLTGIPSQWEGTKAIKPIKAVVMDGGGNDVLIDHPECRPDGSEMQAGCMQVVKNSLDIAQKMWASMKEAGVSDVLYFWYPHIPGGALTGFETANTISDYTYPMLEALAKAASTDTFHVYMIPMVELFEGHPEWFYSDGLHANDAGEAQIAEAIWKVAKADCIMQASGCCMP